MSLAAPPQAFSPDLDAARRDIDERGYRVLPGVLGPSEIAERARPSTPLFVSPGALA